MPDAAAPLRTTSEARTAQEVAELKARVATLERTGDGISAGTGAPTTTPTGVVFYVDISALRLYVYADGGWHYVALT